MEVTQKEKFKDALELKDTSDTSFCQQPTDITETKPQRPPSHAGETLGLKLEKPSQFFHQAEATSKQSVTFEHPASLVVNTPVKYSAQIDNVYSRVVTSTTVRQHSPKHVPTITVSPPSTLQTSSPKLYHPVSTTTTVHQPITVLPRPVSSMIRSPTVVQISPVVEVSRVRRECCEHERKEL